MKRFFLALTVICAMFTSQAFALTMSLENDNRSVTATAMTTLGSDAEVDTPSVDFSDFNSFVSASVPDNPAPPRITAQINGEYDPAAHAGAQQNSSIGSLNIAGNGYANASGTHGLPVPVLTFGDASGEPHEFQADGSSILEVIFSIDESAEFSLQGFISAGLLLASDALSNDAPHNYASVLLVNNTTSTTAFETMISNGSQNLDESGIIGPGNYTFNVQAYAEVYGDNIGIPQDLTGDAEDVFPVNGYYANASFEQVNLSLTAIEQPIPEPLTTTLACLGLGALIIKTSRRHHV